MVEVQTWNLWKRYNVTIILILIMCFHLNINFGMDFVNENSKRLQRLSLKEKISWVLNVFTLKPMA